MKNVMILSVNFPPRGGVGVMRTLKFTKYLPSFGWRPIVVTPPKDKNHIQDNSLSNEVGHSITAHHPPFFDYRNKFPKFIVKLFRSFDKRIFFPDKYVQWNRAAFRYISRNIIPNEKIDLVYTTMSPYSTMLLAHQLKLHYQIPFFLDFRDPFSFNQYVLLDKKETYQKKAFQIEKTVFKDADHINAVSDVWRDTYERLHPQTAQKLSAIHNTYDEEDFNDLGQKIKNKMFTIGYNGTFSRVVPIEPLLAAIIDIHKHHNISICLSIATPIKKKKLISRHPYLFENDLINYKGFLPHQESLKNVYHSDISALILNNMDATEGMIPAKTFEYLRIGNPILLLHRKKGHLSNIITKTNTGICVDITDHGEIIKALLFLYEKWKQNETCCQPNWPEIKKFESKYSTGRLAAIFDQITIQ